MFSPYFGTDTTTLVAVVPGRAYCGKLVQGEGSKEQMKSTQYITKLALHVPRMGSYPAVSPGEGASKRVSGHMVTEAWVYLPVGQRQVYPQGSLVCGRTWKGQSGLPFLGNPNPGPKSRWAEDQNQPPLPQLDTEWRETKQSPENTSNAKFNSVNQVCLNVLMPIIYYSKQHCYIFLKTFTPS